MFNIKKIPEGYWQKEQTFVLSNNSVYGLSWKNLPSLYPITSKSKHFTEYEIHRRKKDPICTEALHITLGEVQIFGLMIWIFYDYQELLSLDILPFSSWAPAWTLGGPGFLHPPYKGSARSGLLTQAPARSPLLLTLFHLPNATDHIFLFYNLLLTVPRGGSDSLSQECKQDEGGDPCPISLVESRSLNMPDI